MFKIPENIALEEGIVEIDISFVLFFIDISWELKAKRPIQCPHL